ncbi:MAG: radical SAM protein [Brevinema sp.]
MGIRYSKFQDGVNDREVVLLKGYPCGYGKCKFCNYIEDNSSNDEEIAKINNHVLSYVTGEFGQLEVLNSGSVFEIPSYTLQHIQQIVKEKQIKVIYFEIYYGYMRRINEIREMFAGVEVRFKMGLETFDNHFRREGYGKNFSLTEADYKVLGEELYSVCLLLCTQGQSKEMIANDIALGQKYFKHITLNVFVNNGTQVKRDDELVKWFVAEYAHLKNDPCVDLLIDNKDLGVFEQ